MLLTDTEKYLLIELCRPKNRLSKTCINKLLDNEINWELLLNYAIYHKVAGYIFSSIKNLNLTEAAPADFTGKLNELIRVKLEKSYKIDAFINTIFQTLESSGIKAILLKGAVFKNIFYKNNGLRFYNDIDIMIRFEDHERAQKLFNSLNFFQYKKTDGKYELYDQSEANNYLTGSKHAAPYFYFESDDFFIQIDVHHNWFRSNESFSITYDDLIKNAQIFDLGTNKLLRLGDIDFFIHSCIHYYWHGIRLGTIGENFKSISGKIGHLLDIYMILDHLSGFLAWEEALNRIKLLDFEIPVGYALNHLTEIFGDIVPMEVLVNFWDEKILSKDKYLYMVDKKSHKSIELKRNISLIDYLFRIS